MGMLSRLLGREMRRYITRACDCPVERALRAFHLFLEKATATANWVSHIWWSNQKQKLQPKAQIPGAETVNLAKGIPSSLNFYCVVLYKAFSVLVGCGYKTIIQRAYICIYFVFHTSPQPHVFLSPKCSIQKKNLLEMCTLKKKEEGEREKKEEEESREGKVWKERGMTLEN